MKKLALIFAAVLLSPLALAQDVKLELTGNDQMQFNTKELEAPVGQEVTLVLKHIGQLPAVAMGHNVVILKPGTALPQFAAKAAMAKDDDYVPQDEESKAAVVAYTKMLGGGEEDTITVTFSEPGDYPFICSFPGHFALMQGVIKVR